MEIKNRARLPDDELQPFVQELKEHRSLQDLLIWASKQPPGALVPGVIADLIIQDEFTHDIIVPWRGRFVVYGST